MSGAGDWGTDKARNRLQADTPGQKVGETKMTTIDARTRAFREKVKKLAYKKKKLNAQQIKLLDPSEFDNPLKGYPYNERMTKEHSEELTKFVSTFSESDISTDELFGAVETWMSKRGYTKVQEEAEGKELSEMTHRFVFDKAVNLGKAEKLAKRFKLKTDSETQSNYYYLSVDDGGNTNNLMKWLKATDGLHESIEELEEAAMSKPQSLEDYAKVIAINPKERQWIMDNEDAFGKYHNNSALKKSWLSLSYPIYDGDYYFAFIGDSERVNAKLNAEANRKLKQLAKSKLDNEEIFIEMSKLFEMSAYMQVGAGDTMTRDELWRAILHIRKSYKEETEIEGYEELEEKALMGNMKKMARNLLDKMRKRAKKITAPTESVNVPEETLDENAEVTELEALIHKFKSAGGYSAVMAERWQKELDAAMDETYADEKRARTKRQLDTHAKRMNKSARDSIQKYEKDKQGK